MFYYLYMKGWLRVNNEYKKWLNKTDLEPSLAEALKAMDDESITDAFYKPVSFGTGGMRGIMGAGINRINVVTLRKAAYGFARFLMETYADAKTRGVAIAYDNRKDSDVFAKVCVEVLAHFGIRSFLFENIRPTPLLSYAVKTLHACGGIVITASHNPPEYNGFKIYDEDGCQLVPEYADRVVEFVNQVDDIFAIERLPFDVALSEGLVEMLGRKIDNAYIEDVKTVQFHPRDKKTIKVVFTPLHGASREIGLRCLSECGYEVIPVEEQMIADNQFKTVKSPNPEDQDAFEYAIRYGNMHQADLLVATDPDGDRVGFAVRHDGKYVFLDGNQTGAIFIHYILDTLKEEGRLPEHGIIYNTIVTSDFGLQIAKTYGVDVHSTLTGFKFIGEQMKRIEKTPQTFLMGYEESYGYIIKDFVRDKDAHQAMVLACEIANRLKAEGQTLIDYLLALYDQFGAYATDLVNIGLKGQAGEQKIQAIMTMFRAYLPETFAGSKVCFKEDYLKQLRFEDDHESVLDYPTSDVLKFVLSGDDWFVLRPSGTEPKLKVYIAVKEQSLDAAKARVEVIKAAIMQKIDKI